MREVTITDQVVTINHWYMVGVIYSVEVSPHKEIAPSKKIFSCVCAQECKNLLENK